MHVDKQYRIAQDALVYIQRKYQVEREDAQLSTDERQRLRQEAAQSPGTGSVDSV